MSRWSEILTRLGQAVVDLLTAECAALTAELKLNGRRLAGALAIFGVAIVLGVAALAMLILALVWFLSQFMAQWAAGLVVGGSLLLAALVLASWARSKMRRLEGPAAIVQRRWESQERFWRQRILSASGSDDGDSE